MLFACFELKLNQMVVLDFFFGDFTFGCIEVYPTFFVESDTAKNLVKRNHCQRIVVFHLEVWGADKFTTF